MQHVAAALELIAGDADVGKENGEGAEHARRLVVAGLKQVGQRELRELARARRDEIDEQQAKPSAGRLPQRGESVAVGVLSARQRASRRRSTKSAG